MLILNRRIGEAVMIADDIMVMVLRINGNRVHLGFEAAPTVPIFREEVYDRIIQEQASSRLMTSEEQIVRDVEFHELCERRHGERSRRANVPRQFRRQVMKR